MQIKDGQKLALIKLCQRFVKGRNARLWIISQLLDREIKSTGELSIDDWRRIRNKAYPVWADDVWEISEEFGQEMHKLSQRYEKEILGQTVLFE